MDCSQSSLLDVRIRCLFQQQNKGFNPTFSADYLRQVPIYEYTYSRLGIGQRWTPARLNRKSDIADSNPVDSWYSTFGSLLTIGAMVGAIPSGRIADFLGRKGALRVSSASYMIGWIMATLLKDAWLLDIGRLFIGFGAGLTSYTVPVYIAEITPKNLRGGLTTTNQLSITIGILIAYLLGMLVRWRLLAFIGIIPCVLLVSGLFFIPESPRWLAKIGHDKEFEEALQTLRGKDCDVSIEAAEIRVLIK